MALEHVTLFPGFLLKMFSSYFKVFKLPNLIKSLQKPTTNRNLLIHVT